MFAGRPVYPDFPVRDNMTKTKIIFKTMIRYHKLKGGNTVAEMLPGSTLITSPEEVLEIMVEAGYQDSVAMILYRESLHGDFFDLKTGLAGEILQKFSNYRFKLSIIGDFSEYKSKSLNDFIRESNRTGIINFAGSLDEALSGLNK